MHEAIQLTLEFCVKQGIDINRGIAEDNVFHNLSLYYDFANIIVGNDEVRNECKVLSNTVDGLYESLRPDIFRMEFDPRYKEAIMYLRSVVDGKIGQRN